MADENVPGAAIDALRARGHDVLWVRTGMPGAKDEDVLARAQADRRIVVTFDKDFGELAFARGLPAACGVVLFRLRSSDSEEEARAVVAVLESRDDWEGHFGAVEDGRLRMRSLPPAPE